MGGPVMWIVLGSLVGVVIIFLVVTTVLDRKKKAKALVKLEKLNKEKRSAAVEVAATANRVAATNRKLLKEFIPSIGKYKMSEIKDKARNELNDFMQTKQYRLAKSLDSNEELIQDYKTLIKEPSTNWDVKLADVLKRMKVAEVELKKAPVVEPKERKNKKAKKVKNESTK